jgi:hypothetical protein
MTNAPFGVDLQNSFIANPKLRQDAFTMLFYFYARMSYRRHWWPPTNRISPLQWRPWVRQFEKTPAPSLVDFDAAVLDPRKAARSAD